jgi:lysophospholipase L1-like esterase
LKFRKFLFCVATILLFAFALTEPSPAVAQDGKIDFSKLVFVGDSLGAGVENGSLVNFQQVHGFANVIARQVGVPLVLPLVPYPGAPNTLELIRPEFPPVIQPVPGVLLFPRLNPFQTVTDLAVPLQTVDNALNLKPNANLSSGDATQLATDLVLGFPCPVLFPWCTGRSQVEQAVALEPTTIIVELGSNDILGAVSSGQLASFTPLQVQTLLTNFNSSYASLLSTLAATHATLIVANIPDVIETAYFIPASKLAEEEGINVGLLAMELGIGPADYVTLSAIPTVEAILINSQQGPLSSACPASAAPCVVTAIQAGLVQEVTSELNGIIAAQAAAHGAVVVDLFSLLDNIYVHGYQIGSVTLTADFLGGLFSLDGLHPTNTGYAILANAFIQQINTSFGTRISPANVKDIAACDPLVLAHPSPCLTP